MHELLHLALLLASATLLLCHPLRSLLAELLRWCHRLRSKLLRICSRLRRLLPELPCRLALRELPCGLRDLRVHGLRVHRRCAVRLSRRQRADKGISAVGENTFTSFSLVVGKQVA